MVTLLRGVTTFAVVSRLAIILFQILFNNVIPDHNADVFDPPLQHVNNTAFDSFIQFCFGGLRRWDAVYFTHIAEHGYTYENCVAFFPFYPLLVAIFSRTVLVFGVLQLSQCVLVAGVVINCALFCLTAGNLYCLSLELGLDTVTSLLSVIVFCINPASIFMTAPYSETLYFYVLILSLLCLRRRLFFRASLLIAVSIATRSNGLVGIGFVLYGILKNFINESGYPGKQEKLFSAFDKKKLIFSIVRNVLRVIVCLAICLSTFVIYQYYIFHQFCSKTSLLDRMSVDVVDYGRSQGYKLVGDEPSSWCFQRIPMSYSYIQANHWGVGFLKYYQVKQIPNFLLATPVVLLSIFACVYFFKMNQEAYFSLGLIRADAVPGKTRDDTQPRENNEDERSVLGVQMVVYVFHLGFLTLFGCCFIHIQVLTRLLFSSSPLLYWYAGSILAKNPAVYSYVRNLVSVTPTSDGGRKMFGTVVARKSLLKTQRDSGDLLYYGLGSWLQCLNRSVVSNICVKILVFVCRNWTKMSLGNKAILIYCTSYVFIGTIMFSNFLPWT